MIVAKLQIPPDFPVQLKKSWLLYFLVIVGLLYAESRISKSAGLSQNFLKTFRVWLWFPWTCCFIGFEEMAMYGGGWQAKLKD